MKSKSALYASVVFLSSIPLALIVQNIFGAGAETVLHFAFAAGSALLAMAAFDFRTPAWISFAGAAATASLSGIFFLQGMSTIVQNESLSYISLDILGQRTERVLIDALLLWLVAILLYESEGRTRFFGVITLAVAISIEIYNYWLNYHGTTLDAEFAILKIALLSPFVWLLFESKKRLPVSN